MTEVIAFLAFVCAVVALYVARETLEMVRDLAFEVDTEMTKLSDDVELVARKVVQK